MVHEVFDGHENPNDTSLASDRRPSRQIRPLPSSHRHRGTRWRGSRESSSRAAGFLTAAAASETSLSNLRHEQKGVCSVHLTIREEERLQIWTAAEMARRRLTRGVKLNEPEAIALISDEILERAREGSIPMLVDMIRYGENILTSDDVMEGVRDMVKIIQVEALFPDGTKLVTVTNPIREAGKSSG
jgi:urease subunit gamma